MRVIKGIDGAIRKIQRHLPEIEENFERENTKFKAFLAQDHDLIGRVLKCHLIVENYLDRFLADHFKSSNLADAKLSFFQKVQLLPDQGSAVAFVKPGIAKLNTVRNKFGHTLQPDLQMGELEPMLRVLHIARPDVHFGATVEVIEAFTTVACTWLIVTPPHLKEAWAEAFAGVQGEM
ncbi:hypothetical protein [Burkholderia cepacia]|uniref:hypothetical protein n=1 Tax=Burkholderia cepacia TaxID=292 RepID=UPI000B31E071|nr:hypothetical protein [Burkholderia cepacia]